MRLALIAFTVFPSVALANEPFVAQAEDLLRAEAHEAWPGADIEVAIDAIDPRIELAPCEDVELAPGPREPIGRVSVAARCHGPHPWSIYLTGYVSVRAPVVVLARPVARRTLISAADLTLEPRDLAALRPRFVTDPEQAIGHEVTRSLSAGDVLHIHQLRPGRLVRRGDVVVIRARTRGVTVTATGVAEEDGAEGEQIGVRNPRSDRIVQARVTGRGEVSVYR